MNGLGLREATVFNVNVYVAALYLLRRASDGEKIAAAEEPKQMRIQFVRNVSKSDMAEAIQKGFVRATGDDYGKLKARVERLMAALPEFKSGDRFTITYRPSSARRARYPKLVRDGKPILSDRSAKKITAPLQSDLRLARA